MSFFKVIKKDPTSLARLGIISTPHGAVRTPAFLPIGTHGSVKAVTAEELRFWGAEMILANTYHLWQRPGDALIRKSGGLHKFMGWDGPIFTDSGGYQVYSLGEKKSLSLRGVRQPADDAAISEIASPSARNDDKRERIPTLKSITNAGVEFRSELDGSQHLLSPEISIQIQSNLGSDIALVLDDVPALPASEDRLKKSLSLTLDWARRAKARFEKLLPKSLNPGQKLYGIVQGGDFEHLRKKSVEKLQEINFDGYGIGGLAVGESAEIMYKVLSVTIPHLEEDKPRHLLGVGYPEQIIKAVSLGLDTFDCVLPTRNARHGQLFVNSPPHEEGPGEVKGYRIINILNSQFAEDFTPVDNTCSCYLCLHHNRAYLRHLFMAREPLGIRLATMHNLRFYLDLMEKIRRAIEFDSLNALLKDFGLSKPKLLINY